MNKAIKSTIMLAAMTAFTLPAFADTIQTTETIRSQKAGVAVTTTTTTVEDASVVKIINGEPTMVVTDTSGRQTIVPAIFPILKAKYTAANGIVIFYPSARGDVSIRRDDLLARVIMERTNGHISASQADGFIARLQNLDSLNNKKITDFETRQYSEQVREIFNGMDKLASDMETSSKMGSRETSNTYGYKIY